ncbi:DUF2927 domain-containing protein [Paracoccus sp. (in: a-proteobacteria)]|uniref:DUF2927 domain-containing protein n=1 Tax=Paracoccus sp. TaxID=267 RepID=UPI003A87BDA9
MSGVAGLSRRPSPSVLALAIALSLGACSDQGEDRLETSPPPILPTRPAERPQADQAELRKARAERNRAANRAATEAASSTNSQSQQDYYGGVERSLLARGKMRRDSLPLDAPIDADRLAKDFALIALRDEYGADGRRMADGGPAPLRRWAAPVRLQLEFGDSIDTATQAQVRSSVSAYAGRLATASQHSVTLTTGSGNFHVLVLNDDERRAIGPRLASLVPGIPPEDIAAMRDLAQGNYCTVFAYSSGNSNVYVHAVALIRAELPPLLRLSCIHEELAQGMGLANDSFAVRPSIFNDDEEFALLTRHDELLLRILYDPRLRPGMTEAEAAPLVHQIAQELLPDEG